MSFAAASKHVRVLEKAGLVQRTVRGRTHLCRLDARRMADAQRWLAHYEQYWQGRFDALDQLFKNPKPRQRPAAQGGDEKEPD